jgi:hypothetical protein
LFFDLASENSLLLASLASDWKNLSTPLNGSFPLIIAREGCSMLAGVQNYPELLYMYKVVLVLKQGFGQAVRAAGWHAGDPGSTLGRVASIHLDVLPQRYESALADIALYKKPHLFIYS